MKVSLLFKKIIIIYNRISKFSKKHINLMVTRSKQLRHKLEIRQRKKVMEIIYNSRGSINLL